MNRYLCYAFCFIMFGVTFLPNTSYGQNLDARLFEPSPSPYGLLGTQATQTLPHLVFFTKLTTHYANDLLLLRRSNAPLEKPFSRPVAARITSELALSLGLFSMFDLSISMPFYLRQYSENYPFGSSSETGKSGLGDLRFQFKWQVVSNQKWSGLGLAFAGELRLGTGSADSFMSEPSRSFTPHLILDYQSKTGFLATLNASYRLREKTHFYNLAVDDELRFSFGVNIPLLYKGLFLSGEVLVAYGLSVVEKNPQGFLQRLPVESLVALHWRHTSGFSCFVGLGTGLSDAVAAPDYRLLFGVAFHFGLASNDPALVGAAWSESTGSRVVLSKIPLRGRREDLRRGVAEPSAKLPPEKIKKTSVHKRLKSPKSPKSPKPPKFKKKVDLSSEQFDKAAAADPDPDKDGINSKIDKCPRKAEDLDGFEDKDGCPDLDNDKDGILDKQDKCPLKPETINGVDDTDGCPDEGISSVSIVGTSIRIEKKIFFNSGSDRLKKISFGILRQIASFLRSRKLLKKIQIAGHTDGIGDKEMNVDLSIRRAQRVKVFLIQMGVASKRLLVRGFGPTYPIAKNKTRSGRAKNRRVQFTVIRVAVPKHLLAPVKKR